MKKYSLLFLLLSLLLTIGCEQNDGPPEGAIPVADPKQRIFGPEGLAVRQEGQMPANHPSTTKNEVAVQREISVKIEIAPELKERTRPDQIVFIFAKAVQGPKAPLAVARLTVEDLPETVILDDSMAMAPMFTISKFDHIYVSAKISQDGQAITKSGDLTSGNQEVDFTKPVKELALIINRITP